MMLPTMETHTKQLKRSPYLSSMCHADDDHHKIPLSPSHRGDDVGAGGGAGEVGEVVHKPSHRHAHSESSGSHHNHHHSRHHRHRSSRGSDFFELRRHPPKQVKTNSSSSSSSSSHENIGNNSSNSVTFHPYATLNTEVVASSSSKMASTTTNVDEKTTGETDKWTRGGGGGSIDDDERSSCHSSSPNSSTASTEVIGNNNRMKSPEDFLDFGDPNHRPDVGVRAATAAARRNSFHSGTHSSSNESGCRPTSSRSSHVASGGGKIVRHKQIMKPNTTLLVPLKLKRGLSPNSSLLILQRHATNTTFVAESNNYQSTASLHKMKSKNGNKATNIKASRTSRVAGGQGQLASSITSNNNTSASNLQYYYPNPFSQANLLLLDSATASANGSISDVDSATISSAASGVSGVSNTTPSSSSCATQDEMDIHEDEEEEEEYVPLPLGYRSTPGFTCQSNRVRKKQALTATTATTHPSNTNNNNSNINGRMKGMISTNWINHYYQQNAHSRNHFFQRVLDPVDGPSGDMNKAYRNERWKEIVLDMNMDDLNDDVSGDGGATTTMDMCGYDGSGEGQGSGIDEIDYETVDEIVHGHDVILNDAAATTTTSAAITHAFSSPPPCQEDMMGVGDAHARPRSQSVSSSPAAISAAIIAAAKKNLPLSYVNSGPDSPSSAPTATTRIPPRRSKTVGAGLAYGTACWSSFTSLNGSFTSSVNESRTNIGSRGGGSGHGNAGFGRLGGTFVFGSVGGNGLASNVGGFKKD